MGLWGAVERSGLPILFGRLVNGSSSSDRLDLAAARRRQSDRTVVTVLGASLVLWLAVAGLLVRLLG